MKRLPDDADLDVLDYIWSRQKEFNRNLVDYENLTHEKKQELTKAYVVHLYTEMAELLNTINWKLHKKHTKEVVISNTLEEIIDAFKYLMCICLVWDISPSQFLQAFDDKSTVVEQNYFQEFKLKLGDICVFDIDGCLCDYPLCFIDFLRDDLGYTQVPREMPTTLDPQTFLKNYLTPTQILDAKKIYRLSGSKRNLPVYQDSVEFLRYLRFKGKSIVLMTARPYDKYKRIYSDTLYWLNKNEIPFDSIIWDENKAIRTIKDYGDKVVFFVEDNLPEAIRIANYGFKSFLINKPYNQSNETYENLIRIDKMSDIKKYIEL